MKTATNRLSAQPEKNTVKNNSAPGQTPYLKAILTGAIRLMRSEQWLDDRAAASRYIKESSLMRG
jgi:SOS response regulatory protein OraA/RecX